MSNINLEDLPLEDLRKLRKDVEKAIESYTERKKAEARKKLEEVARDYGYSLSELAEAATQRKRKPAAPKYANPKDPSQTWTGRGRKPHWVTAALERGKSLESLLIKR